MRMIDADARVTVQSFDVEHEEYNHTKMSVEEALDFATDEGCPPVIDAEPVRHGRWEENVTTYAGPGLVNWRCSKCKNIGGTWLREIADGDMYRYCPWCGAKMDGDENAVD